MWDHNILLTSYTAMKPKSCRYLHSGLHRQKYGADISRPDEIFGLFYLGDMHNTYLALLKKLSQMCVKKLRGSNSCFPSHSLFQPPTKGGLVVQAVQEEAKGGGARWEERGGVGPAETRLKVSRRLQLKLHQNSSGFSLPRKRRCFNGLFDAWYTWQQRGPSSSPPTSPPSSSPSSPSPPSPSPESCDMSLGGGPDLTRRLYGLQPGIKSTSYTAFKWV